MHLSQAKTFPSHAMCLRDSDSVGDACRSDSPERATQHTRDSGHAQDKIDVIDAQTKENWEKRLLFMKYLPVPRANSGHRDERAP